MTIRTYSELITFASIEDRYTYLRLNSRVGDDTFGFERYLNQSFYRSQEWKRTRDAIIIRDNGCDLGVDDFEIFGQIIIHHMNPISKSDLYELNPDVLNPEFLISTTLRTHNAIHYGDARQLLVPIERRPGDTTLW